MLELTGQLLGYERNLEAASNSAISQADLPIFNQDWWISTACKSSNFRALKVVIGDAVVGRFPIVLTRNRFGLVQAHDPHWSHLGGPVVDERLSRSEQAEVIDRLLEQLPRWASFYFICNPDAPYADLTRAAFACRGFQQSAQLTFVRYPTDGEVMASRSGKHRGHIRRAAKELDCIDICARDFVRFFQSNLEARGKASYSPLGTLELLIGEALGRGQARALAATSRNRRETGSNGDLIYDAAIVYAWDRMRCYYWLSTNRPAESSDLRPHPDAIKLLALRAMEDAQSMNLIFDADGVTTPGTQNLYRNMFGLREELRRDIFHRSTFLERVHRRYRPHFKALIAR
jgi:hypothetical protein